MINQSISPVSIEQIHQAIMQLNKKLSSLPRKQANKLLCVRSNPYPK